MPASSAVRNRMPHTSARVLEFESLREILQAYAVSELGRTRVASLAASLDAEWICRQQQLAAEIGRYLATGARFDFGGLLDPARSLERSRIEGAALETTEIRDLLLLVDRAAEWREIVLHPPAALSLEWPAVQELSSGVADFTELLRFFRNKILPDGMLDDRASPELARIRRDVEKQKRAIQESLRAYLRALAEGGAVQEELVTIRGERFVIPIKVEQRRKVQGVVHAASSSGQTVFVEPLETIEQNNDLVRLLEEEQAEIQRILREMTERLAARSLEIAAAAEILAELELQFAKARFAQDYNCIAPSVSSAGVSPAGAGTSRSSSTGHAKPKSVLHLRLARHPVLERTLRLKNRQVVPITLPLSRDPPHALIHRPHTP